MTGKLITAPSTSSIAGFNLPVGVAPLAPKDGDMWTTAGGLYVQMAGVTIGPINAGLPATAAANKVLAGPTSGGAAAPTFRLLGLSDLPTQTGTGSIVLGTSPVIATPTVTGGTFSSPALTTPLLGVASATSINKVAFTAPATAATYAPANGTTTTTTTSTSIGQGQYLATATNDNATAGNIGEYVASDIATPGSSITSGTPTNLTSISLGAGDWDVSCSITFVPAGTTTASFGIASLSTVSGTLDTTLGRQTVLAWAPNTAVSGTRFTAAVFPSRFSLSTTTTVYCVGNVSFATSTMTFYGNLHARRVR